MPAQDKIRRYNLIIEKISKSKKPSFKDIQYFLLKHDFPISHRTLQRDIEQIKYQLNISIEYEKSMNGYFIAPSNYSTNVVELLQQKSFYSDLIEFAKESPKQSESILLDNDFHQVGFHFIQEILFAIRQQRTIEFEYQKFKDDQSKVYSIEPYALKEYENRWYLVGVLTGETNLYKFGVERIIRLNVGIKKFKKNKNISAKAHFEQMIGINDERRTSEIVQLAFSHFLSKYIETLPLHWTQKRVSDDQDWVVYEYYLIPNFELEQKILGFGSDIKVIEPLQLKNRIVAILQKTLDRY